MYKPQPEMIEYKLAEEHLPVTVGLVARLLPTDKSEASCTRGTVESVFLVILDI